MGGGLNISALLSSSPVSCPGLKAELAEGQAMSSSRSASQGTQQSGEG